MPGHPAMSLPGLLLVSRETMSWSKIQPRNAAFYAVDALLQVPGSPLELGQTPVDKFKLAALQGPWLGAAAWPGDAHEAAGLMMEADEQVGIRLRQWGLAVSSAQSRGGLKAWLSLDVPHEAEQQVK